MLEKKKAYSREELLECGYKGFAGPGTAQLPVPQMLMFDRITHIDDNSGEYGKGRIEAELDINPDLWFFDCHFPGDPVMPGCLGLDALWQLIGFYLTWSGNSWAWARPWREGCSFFGYGSPACQTCYI